MKKLLFLVLFSAFIGGGVSIFYHIFSTNDSFKQDEANITCDLNFSDCNISIDSAHTENSEEKSKTIKLSFSPRPLVGMTPIMLTISGLQSGIKDPNIRITGLNMDMGVIKANLKELNEEYQTQVVISLCVLARMEYKLEIFSGDKPLGARIDFYIKS